MGYAFPDATERFFPTSGGYPTASAKFFRTGLDVYQCTGGCTIYPAIQTSQDAEAWPAATSFTRVGSLSATGDGISYSTGADTDMTTSLQSRYFREGFTIKGDVGNSVLRMALVATSFFKRPC